MGLPEILPFGLAISLYANLCAIVSVAGLVIGTFELAFNRLYDQVIVRMFLHVFTIPIAAYLSMKEWKIDAAQTTVVAQTKYLLGWALLNVGIIGITIGTIELGLVPATRSLANRMLFYACCLAISIPLLPLVDIQQQ